MVAIKTKPEEHTIRVMSYNIQCIPSFILPSTNMWTRKKVIPAFVRELVDKYAVDVLVLQELMDNSMFHVLKMTLADVLPYTTGTIGNKDDLDDWDSTHDCSEMPFHFTNGGVCIFTKYKILEKHQMVFKNCRNTCALGSKGACLAVLEMPGKLLNVVGTHLQSYDGPSMEVRKRQFLEILYWMEDLFNRRVGTPGSYSVSKEHPFVMAGDFNTCCVNHKADFDVMFAQSQFNGFVPFELTLSEDTKAPTYSSYTNDYCKLTAGAKYSHLYDYILAGPGVRVVHPQTVVHDKLRTPISVVKFYLHCIGFFRKEIYYPSDHFPVYSVLSF